MYRLTSRDEFIGIEKSPMGHLDTKIKETKSCSIILTLRGNRMFEGIKDFMNKRSIFWGNFCFGMIKFYFKVVNFICYTIILLIESLFKRNGQKISR